MSQQKLIDCLNEVSVSVSNLAEFLSKNPFNLNDQTTATTTTNKRKFKRDPNLPKLPLTSYFQFLKANRDKTQKEIDGMEGDHNINDILSKKWNNLSSLEKEVCFFNFV